MNDIQNKIAEFESLRIFANNMNMAYEQMRGYNRSIKEVAEYLANNTDADKSDSERYLNRAKERVLEYLEEAKEALAGISEGATKAAMNAECDAFLAALDSLAK